MKKHSSLSLSSCLSKLLDAGKADLLVAVLFWAREGLGVDMSQGDELIPLQVSHQNANLRLHQADPERNIRIDSQECC